MAVILDEFGRVVGFRNEETGLYQQPVSMFGGAETSPFEGSVFTSQGPVQVYGAGGVREQYGEAAAAATVAVANAEAKTLFYGSDSEEAKAAVEHARERIGTSGLVDQGSAPPSAVPVGWLVVGLVVVGVLVLRGRKK